VLDAIVDGLHDVLLDAGRHMELRPLAAQAED
jgi:hypothetical protein